PGQVEQRLEVVAGRRRVRFRLVGDAPQHHAGVVLVARHKFAYRLGVYLAAAFVDRLVGEGDTLLSTEDAPGETEVLPDGRRLADDHDALPVGIVEDFVGVGVVRGAERVGADPAQQRE